MATSKSCCEAFCNRTASQFLFHLGAHNFHLQCMQFTENVVLAISTVAVETQPGDWGTTGVGASCVHRKTRNERQLPERGDDPNASDSSTFCSKWLRGPRFVATLQPCGTGRSPRVSRSFAAKGRSGSPVPSMQSAFGPSVGAHDSFARRRSTHLRRKVPKG